ncbi:MAG TPA: DUF3830 family protein [Methylomirabilota bacterium]
MILDPTRSIRIQVGPLAFTASWEEGAAPRTCAAFRRLLPYRQRIIQARWSGEAGWIPLGDFDLGVDLENTTSEPAPGALLFHPAGISETEILFPYGATRFASVKGPLAGNHFLTIVDGREQLTELGRLLCWEGAQSIIFEA